jgi:hypothetical protein
LEELSLFEEDPFVEEISLLDEKPIIDCQSNHLYEGEVLLHEGSFSVEIQGDSGSINGEYQAHITNYRAFFIAPAKQPVSNGSQCNHEMPVSIPFSLMSEIDIIKSQEALTLKTGISILIKSTVGEIQQLHRHFLKGYMAIPFFPKQVFPQDEAITYDCLVEMQRQRMNWDFFIIVKNDKLKLCSTYPKYFVPFGLAR